MQYTLFFNPNRVLNPVRVILLIFALFFSLNAFSQTAFMYRISLTDKGTPPYGLNEAEKFLSPKSLARRAAQGLALDSHDLPIDTAYFRQIAEAGGKIRTWSKWTETVVVDVIDTAATLPALLNLPFVDTVQCVWKGDISDIVASSGAPSQSVIPSETNLSQNIVSKYDNNNNFVSKYDNEDYGNAIEQISVLNGIALHAEGFRGAGVEVAVIDGGFTNADKIDFFDNTHIIDIRSFSHERVSPVVSAIDHGTKVLSCMMACKSGEMIGTAPEATFRLLRSEYDGQEYPVEEDYWVAALEYADSAGVDVVNSSLGYSVFDDPAMNHSTADLDGQTVPISCAASLAASRGIMVFNSAGNEGRSDNSWGTIICPADAHDMMAVGSITRDSTRSSFSSRGNTADGRIKPDLMSVGANPATIDYSGAVSLWSSGTSFASPILCGLGACLRGAFPQVPAARLIQLMRESGHQYESPDSLMGYGIPDVYKVYSRLKDEMKITPVADSGVSLYVNGDRLYVKDLGSSDTCGALLTVFSGYGHPVLSMPQPESSVDISSLPRGFYVACLQNGTKHVARKFVKY